MNNNIDSHTLNWHFPNKDHGLIGIAKQSYVLAVWLMHKLSINQIPSVLTFQSSDQEMYYQDVDANMHAKSPIER
jgi:hypothetical protein